MFSVVLSSVCGISTEKEGHKNVLLRPANDRNFWANVMLRLLSLKLHQLLVLLQLQRFQSRTNYMALIRFKDNSLRGVLLS